MSITIRKIKQFAKERDVKLNEMDNGSFWILQDSAIIEISVDENTGSDAWVEFFSIVVDGARIDIELMKKLLEVNTRIKFCSFGLEDDRVLLKHSIMGGEHMDIDEFFNALAGIALLADEYDDKIINTHGGKTGLSLLREAVRENEGRNTLPW